MNKIYKIIKQKLRKTVQWIILKWHLFKKKTFLKPPPSFKYVNPFHSYYLKSWCYNNCRHDPEALVSMLKEGKPQMGISSVIDILEPCMEDKGLLQQGGKL